MDAPDCPECGGSGERTHRSYSVDPSSGVPVPDPQCDVTETCGRCHGTGVDDGLSGWYEEYEVGRLE